MRLRLWDRIRRIGRRSTARSRRAGAGAPSAPAAGRPASVTPAGSHRRTAPPKPDAGRKPDISREPSGRRPGRAGRADFGGQAESGGQADLAGTDASGARPGAGGQAEAGRPAAGTDAATGPATGAGQRPGDAGGRAGGRHSGPASDAGLARRFGPARAAVRTAPGAQRAAAAAAKTAAGKARRASKAKAAKRPWYEIAQSNRTAAGRRHCGLLEQVLHRQWAPDGAPPPEIATAVDRLAELPQLIKEKLVAGLDAIYVGPGGVPDLDDMGTLSGVPLPSGRSTWDVCAGAYGDRKIIVGSRPSPTPDVMCHEIGHALDDLDGADGQWQSDGAEFRALYEQCLPSLISSFHRQRGALGRREFFADAFAAIASSQRPALVDMLSGDTRAALTVMLYFNVRYGI
jgi:hypothetical protein